MPRVRKTKWLNPSFYIAEEELPDDLPDKSPISPNLAYRKDKGEMTTHDLKED